MSTIRKPISKRKRFEVLKRDSFTCQYCNAKPPKVPLEVDHIHPISKGGDNSIDNLVTACFDCNRGKSNIELDNIPETLIVKTERKNKALQQYKQYQKILKKLKAQTEEDIERVAEIYENFNKGYTLSDKFRISVKTFIKKLGVEEVEESMESACTKTTYGTPLKYFCGICWTKIKEGGYE